MLSISSGDEDLSNNRTVRPPKGGMDDKWDGGEPVWMINGMVESLIAGSVSMKWRNSILYRDDRSSPMTTMRPIHQKGIASHVDGGFSIDRPDSDNKEPMRVDTCKNIRIVLQNAYFRKTGLERSDALSKDLEWMSQQDIVIPEPSSTGLTYVKYLEELAETSPGLCLSHFYNIYFSHIAGNQVIAKQHWSRDEKNKC